MHLVQLLLPLHDNAGEPFSHPLYEAVRAELTTRFGGCTAYSHAPAEGLWTDDRGATNRDEVVVFEVMVDDLDRGWWASYRTELERRFRQEELLIRASAVERL